MRLLPYGDRAVLIEVDGPPADLRAALLGVTGIEETVPAARTLLVRFDPGQTDPARIAAAAEAAVLDGPSEQATTTVTLQVVYDGADLTAVAEHAACSVDEVISRHLAGEYTVAFCGFAPGFAYLTGLDERLHVPRRASPRTSVPAGAVAIAGEYTAAYPRPSPGGWQLLGHTTAVLWDTGRADPALLVPGTRVRFEAAG
jgi:KipI family sensor histidine kinase inhibitor